MFDPKIYDYSVAELTKWLSEEAGTADKNYFLSKKNGGLALCQVPTEYAELLCLLREWKPQYYLELGIASGSSFMLNTFFARPKFAEWVDNLSYGHTLERDIVPKIDYLDKVQPETTIYGNLCSTGDFFSMYSESGRFDCIFIDADHSYECVKKDYQNSLKRLNEQGKLIFHDISSVGAPGVVNLWSEIKLIYKHKEIIHSKTCGIGIIYT